MASAFCRYVTVDAPPGAPTLCRDGPHLKAEGGPKPETETIVAERLTILNGRFYMDEGLLNQKTGIGPSLHPRAAVTVRRGRPRRRSDTYANARKSPNRRPRFPPPFGGWSRGRRLAPMLPWKVWAQRLGSGRDEERDGAGGVRGLPRRGRRARVRSHGIGPERLLRHQRRHPDAADGACRRPSHG